LGCGRGSAVKMKIILLVSLYSFALAKIAVDNINKCPPLKPRDAPPSNVRDLRPDDIEVSC
jgi:hypothetical protein